MTTQAGHTSARTNKQEGIRNSRVGKRPVPLPKGVTALVKADRSIEIKGPKGALVRALPPGVDVKVEGGSVLIVPTVVGRDGARYQGLARSLTMGMVTGVAEGYTKTLQLVGTGYRAELKGQILHLSLG